MARSLLYSTTMSELFELKVYSVELLGFSGRGGSPTYASRLQQVLGVSLGDGMQILHELPFNVSRTVSWSAAKHMANALESVGAKVVIRELTQAFGYDDEDEDTVASGPRLVDTSPLEPAAADARPSCPRCSRPVIWIEECYGCGVIFSRLRRESA